MKDPGFFVRVTASLFLSLSVLCVFVDLISFFFFHYWLDFMPNMKDFYQSMGPLYAWEMGHMQYFYGPHFLLSLTGLTVTLGLLFKKTWALPAFSYLLAICILVHLVSVGFSIALACTLPEEITFNGIATPRAFMILSSGFGVLFALGTTVLYIWLWISFRKKEVQALWS
jgi:hypothetical protein